jgi:hypothetical protein
MSDGPSHLGVLRVGWRQFWMCSKTRTRGEQPDYVQGTRLRPCCMCPPRRPSVRNGPSTARVNYRKPFSRCRNTLENGEQQRNKSADIAHACSQGLLLCRLARSESTYISICTPNIESINAKTRNLEGRLITPSRVESKRNVKKNLIVLSHIQLRGFRSRAVARHCRHRTKSMCVQCATCNLWLCLTAPSLGSRNPQGTTT